MEEKNNIDVQDSEKNENKKLIIVVYIVILIVAICGPVIAITQQLQNNQVEVDNKDNDKQEDNEELENTDKPVDSNDENEEFDDYIDMDAALTKLKIDVTSNDRFKIIQSSDVNGFMSDEFLGEMYKSEISDQYKLLYTIKFLHDKLNEAMIDFRGNTACEKIKKDTLLKYARMLFEDVEIPNNINKNLHYAFNSNLVCYEELCTYTSEITGLTGLLVTGYESYMYDRGEQVIVDAFYVEYDNEKYLENNYNYVIADVTLKDNFNGKILKTMNDHKIQVGDDSEGEFDSSDMFFKLGGEIDEIPRYVFKFNSKNTLVSVERG